MAPYSEQGCIKWLKENCFVNVKKEWMDACIEFLKQEHSGGFSSQSQLNNLVYEQLLMADFQEISLGTLPNLDTGKTASTLQGKHSLQINSVMDVGQPAHSQIQKLKGKDDIESPKENTSGNWEPKVKPSRMLYLHLTDGFKSLQAMEYQSIPCLSQSTLPGTKIQIQGPVMCRLGVLLLTSKHVYILGGSVDELIEANSTWKILHNAIGQEAPEQPPCLNSIKEKSDLQVTTESQVYNALNGNEMERSINNNSRYQQSYISSNGSACRPGNHQRTSSFSQKQNSSHRQKETPRNLNSNKIPQSCGTRRINSYCNEEIKDRDMFDIDDNLFDDNFNDTLDFDQLDQIEQEVMEDFNDNFDFDQLDQIEMECTQSRKPDQNCNSSHNEKFDEDFDEDFLNDDFEIGYFDMEQSEHAELETGGNVNKVVKNDCVDKGSKNEKQFMPMAKKMKFSMDKTEPDKTCVGFTPLNVVKTDRREDSALHSSSSCMKNSKSETKTAQTMKRTGKIGLTETNTKTHQTTLQFSTQQTSLGVNNTNNRDTFFEHDNLVGSIRIERDTTTTAADKTESVTTGVSKSKGESEKRKMGSVMRNERKSKMKAAQGRESNEMLGLQKSNQNLSKMEYGVQLTLQDSFVKPEQTIEVIDLVEEDDTDMPRVESNEDTETSLPFTYLSHVLKDQPCFRERTVRIKGYISTLVSHSQVSDLNQRWKVVVKINDGSASVNATLGEEVLTQLLGTPLQSFQNAMLEAKNSRDPVMCQALQQSTVQFQTKLSQISCLMDVHFTSSESESYPLVVRLIEPSRDEIIGLISRLR